MKYKRLETYGARMVSMRARHYVLAGVLAGSLLTLAAICAADLREVLMERDREFDRVTAARGSEGWASFFAEQGRMVATQGSVDGRAAIRKAMAPFLDATGNSLRWKPLWAGVAASGDLGYTVGESRRVARAPDGLLTESFGRYITVWRKQADG